MITFYPGPSKVYPSVVKYVEKAHKQGLLSANHRSPEFQYVYENADFFLKKKLNIPEEYYVFFTSSATECWEIIAQSFIREKSFHLFNGAFGKKWFEYAQKLKPQARSVYFDLQQEIDLDNIPFAKEAEVICITQNETSNGTRVTEHSMDQLRKAYPDKLIAVDATSSMAGVYLKFNQADIWLASVQKCFGLPSGLGLLICSPLAIEQARSVGEYDHYNSLLFMLENAEKYQTHYTPNILDIYLLYRIMKKADPIKQTDQKITKRAKKWYSYFEKFNKLQLLIEKPDLRSDTVITVSGQPDLISKIKIKAREKGIILGNGYGELKASTFRLANFPAIKNKEIEKLQEFLNKYKD